MDYFFFPFFPYFNIVAAAYLTLGNTKIQENSHWIWV